MKIPGRAGLGPLSLLALCAVALVAAACSPAGAPAPATAAPSAPGGPIAGPIAPAAPIATPTTAKASTIPAGVDANGDFYRGDPKAPVKLVEWSDFQ